MTKTDLIKHIIENSMSFQNGNIEYEVAGRMFTVTCKKENGFIHTEIIVNTAPFGMSFIHFNKLTEKIEVVITANEAYYE
mgnify:FL=1